VYVNCTASRPYIACDIWCKILNLVQENHSKFELECTMYDGTHCRYIKKLLIEG